MYTLSNGTKIYLSRLSLTGFFSVYNQHEPYLTEFERKYHTSLLEIQEYCEKPSEPLSIEIRYVFDDNLGGYSIDAIKKSLEEK